MLGVVRIHPSMEQGVLPEFLHLSCLPRRHGSDWAGLARSRDSTSRKSHRFESSEYLLRQRWNKRIVRVVIVLVERDRGWTVVAAVFVAVLVVVIVLRWPSCLQLRLLLSLGAGWHGASWDYPRADDKNVRQCWVTKHGMILQIPVDSCEVLLRVLAVGCWWLLMVIE